MYDKVASKATRTLKWATLGQLLTKGVQPLILLILARILIPEEYGILELAILVVALAQILQEFGLNRALIQTPADVKAAASIVFWLNLSLSGIAYSLLFVLAPTVSNLFGQPAASPILRIAGLQLLILAFGTVQVALAQRDLEFHRQFLGQLAGAVTMALTSLGLAMMGLRLWAFIIGSLAGSFTQVTTFWIVSPWRPTVRFDRQLTRKLLTFGGLVAVEVFQGWFLNFGDNFILGYFLGIEKLGLYALAFNISVFSLGLIINPITSVSYASFSLLGSEIEGVRRAFLNILELIALIVLPFVIGLVMIADPVATFVLGEQWTGIARLIQILAISPGLSYIVVVNAELYKALGKPEIMPRVLTVAILISFPLYIIGVQFGLLGFTIARFSIGAIFFPVHVIIATRVLKIPIRHIWDATKTPVVAGLGMAVTIQIMLSFFDPFQGAVGWIKLVALVCVAVLSYLVVLRWIDRELLSKTMTLIRQSISPRPSHQGG
jgi:O-antigen/teichoic acid export membrane protein